MDLRKLVVFGRSSFSVFPWISRAAIFLLVSILIRFSQFCPLVSSIPKDEFVSFPPFHQQTRNR